MNATKRKFNALLQGLSSPSSPATPPDARSPASMNTVDARNRGAAAAAAASPDALLQKRRRLGLSEATTPPSAAHYKLGSPSPAAASPSSFSSPPLRKLGVQATTPTARTTATTTTTTITAVTPAGRDALVKYCPGDRDELLRRLATFQELTDWTPKPDRVNEVQWAKRGWVCQGRERVRCLLCHRELLVKLNRRDVDGQQVPVLVSSEIEGALVDKYCDLIVSSHQHDCLWRRRGCDDSLLRLSFSNDRATLAALRRRYDDLCARAAFLPYAVDLRLPAELDVDAVLSLLPPDFFADAAASSSATASPAAASSAAASSSAAAASPQPAVNRPALALALAGWQGLSNPRIGAVPNTASCHTCLRRLGLWMFKSKELGPDGRVVVPAAMDHLDPLGEHRFFCPWRSPEAQSRGSATAAASSAAPMAAWRMLLQTIANEASLRGVYEGRRPASLAASAALDDGASAAPTAGGGELGDAAAAEADEKARDAKDKERWARLRKVKSLFDTKGAKMLRRSISINRGEGAQAQASNGA